MFKFLCFGKKSAATDATAATFCSSTGSSTYGKSSSTVAPPMIRCFRLFSRLKNLFYRCFCSSCSSTLSNFALEKTILRERCEISPSNHERIVISPVDDVFGDDFLSTFEGASYEVDEYNGDDFERWLEAHEDEFNEVGWPEWWDAVEDGENRKSWCREAVDEAIDSETPGQYPAMGDIPF